MVFLVSISFISALIFIISLLLFEEDSFKPGLNVAQTLELRDGHRGYHKG
jgi:hypothetical protein